MSGEFEQLQETIWQAIDQYLVAERQVVIDFVQERIADLERRLAIAENHAALWDKFVADAEETPTSPTPPKGWPALRHKTPEGYPWERYDEDIP